MLGPVGVTVARAMDQSDEQTRRVPAAGLGSERLDPPVDAATEYGRGRGRRNGADVAGVRGRRRRGRRARLGARACGHSRPALATVELAGAADRHPGPVGCNEALRKPGQSYDSVVEKIVVHHTVTPNNPSDPAAVVRSVYEYNVSGVYIDIAYHFLIDQNGRIYEGRWAQNYPAGCAAHR